MTASTHKPALLHHDSAYSYRLCTPSLPRLRRYYQFEYVAQAPNFTRHALTTVGVNNGSLYTLTTGANQRRWKKMEDRGHSDLWYYRKIMGLGGEEGGGSFRWPPSKTIGILRLG